MASGRFIAALLALSLSLGSVSAEAATQLETARAQAKSARQVLSDGRKQQMALRSELNQVSTRIESMKAKGQTFLSNPELDAQLRKSQELSASLTSLAQSLAQAEQTSQSAALSLLNVLNDELTRLRAALEKSQSREERKTLIAQIRSVRDEREQLRAQLPATAVPQLNTTTSDDPDDLLEQADALRDSEDKLRSQMKQLQARIQEAREEKELDRRIDDFSRDESMFDDQDRRLRLRKESTAALHVDRAPPLSDSNSTAREADMSASPTSGGTFNANAPTPNDQTPQAGIGADQNLNNVASATDALPVVGKMKPNGEGGGDVESLEAQLKRLQKQADELKARADALEAKAKQ